MSEEILSWLDEGEFCRPDVCKYRPSGCGCTEAANLIRRLTAENSALMDVIDEAYNVHAGSNDEAWFYAAEILHPYANQRDGS